MRIVKRAVAVAAGAALAGGLAFGTLSIVGDAQTAHHQAHVSAMYYDIHR